MDSLRHFPLGDPITGSPHSVCASLPTLGDILAYEEGDPRVRNALRAGYPRFIEHPYIRRLREEFQRQLGLQGEVLSLAATEQAARELAVFAELPETRVVNAGGFWGLRLPEGDSALRLRAKQYLQHTGNGLSSREAEAQLVEWKLLDRAHPEVRASGDADTFIRRTLHSIYGTARPEDIWLARGGMNAFYAAFRALQALQAPRGRTRWVRLGWLYVDTWAILEKFTGGALDVFDEVQDLNALSAYLESQGNIVAGIVTETPTNPLVQTTDLPRLRELADRHGIPLILDPSIASPHNAQVFPYADIHINSLTKYAAPEADVMLGAVALNRRCSQFEDLRAALPQWLARPHPADTARLASQIVHYDATVQRINASTERVAAFLESHPQVDRVWWARQAASRPHYDRLARHASSGPGCMVTFTVRRPLAEFYDRVRMVKGPSFGAAFSILCPFLYLAHYDLVRSEAGRQHLQAAGLPPELLRLSVGFEDPETLIAVLNEALS